MQVKNNDDLNRSNVEMGRFVVMGTKLDHNEPLMNNGDLRGQMGYSMCYGYQSVIRTTVTFI